MSQTITQIHWSQAREFPVSEQRKLPQQYQFRKVHSKFTLPGIEPGTYSSVDHNANLWTTEVVKASSSFYWSWKCIGCCVIASTYNTVEIVVNDQHLPTTATLWKQRGHGSNSTTTRLFGIQYTILIGDLKLSNYKTFRDLLHIGNRINFPNLKCNKILKIHSSFNRVDTCLCTQTDGIQYFLRQKNQNRQDYSTIHSYAITYFH